MNETDIGVMDEIVRRIVQMISPRKIVLFGSRARGEGRENSDVDLLVIKESTKPRYRRAGPLYTALADLPVDVEVMVYTPEEVLQWEAVPEAFVTTAMREGKVVYEIQG
ncbi:MAG: hypothetical protein AMS14_06400 [Planctomycetes bacterium DG_20]|nr:MAG: hypothetical protein AMS14_06400 [Planctomycetes bacterium DG_20]